MKIKAKTTAWVSNYSVSSLLDSMSSNNLTDKLCFYSGDFSGAGYVRVGDATIEVDVDPEFSFQQTKVDALRQQIDEIKSKADAKVAALESTLLSLLEKNQQPLK